MACQRSKPRESCQPDPFCLRTPHLRPAGLGRWHSSGRPTRLRSCCALAAIFLSLSEGQNYAQFSVECFPTSRRYLAPRSGGVTIANFPSRSFRSLRRS